MAFYHYPEFTKPLRAYVNSPKQAKWADEVQKILQEFPELKVWKIQCKSRGIANNCFYTGFRDKDEPLILNLTAIPSNLNVEFRYSRYFPEDVRDSFKWQTKSMNYVDLKTYGQQKVYTFIAFYLETIRQDFEAGTLKQGGKSFAETIVTKCIQGVFPGRTILNNKRPDSLRSRQDRNLELDLLLADIGLAIEIQGPQHFGNGIEYFGSNATLKENDQVKKQWCLEKGIKLVWIDWRFVNEHLNRMRHSQRITLLGQVFTRFMNSDSPFMFIKADGSYEMESGQGASV